MSDSISDNLLEKWRPVQALQLLKHDAIVVRGNNDALLGESVLGSRPGLKKPINKFTPKSWSNLKSLVQNTYLLPCSLITLTYPVEFPLSGEHVKSHLDSFLKALRYRWRFIAYVWFLEFQKRDAPHFHILTTNDLSYYGLVARWRKRRGKWHEYYTNLELHDWCSHRWSDIVYHSARWSVKTSDQEKHIKVGCSWEQLMLQDAAVRYVAKHFSKASQKQVPPQFLKVGRFWGASRSVREAVTPVGEISTTATSLEDSLRALGWFGMPFYDELGHWPRVLFGVGELALNNPTAFNLEADQLAWLEGFLAGDSDMEVD